MKTLIKMSVTVFAFVMIFAISAVAQLGQRSNDDQKPKASNSVTSDVSSGNPVMGFAGKVAVIVIKSAAKTVWVTTKFAAKDMAKPILFKLLPVVTKYSLKFTGVAAKRLLPHAAKLAIL